MKKNNKVSKIKVDKKLKKNLPKEFLNLNELEDYMLTKIATKNIYSMILPNQCDFGFVEIIEVEEGLPGIRIYNFKSYIRTSAIQKVLASDKNSILFETKGGIYKLERRKGYL